MNLFTHAMLIICYILGINIFLIDESNGFNQTTIEINKCSFEQVNQTQVTHSTYIEQVTEKSYMLHASEPIRFSIKAHVTERELNELPDTWITIHFLNNATLCFAPDHKKTQEMQQKSENVHEQLQKRMNGFTRKEFNAYEMHRFDQEVRR